MFVDYPRSFDRRSRDFLARSTIQRGTASSPFEMCEIRNASGLKERDSNALTLKPDFVQVFNEPILRSTVNFL